MKYEILKSCPFWVLEGGLWVSTGDLKFGGRSLCIGPNFFRCIVKCVPITMKTLIGKFLVSYSLGTTPFVFYSNFISFVTTVRISSNFETGFLCQKIK